MKWKGDYLVQKKFGIKIKVPPHKSKNLSKFQQVRLIPNEHYYMVEIVYKENIVKNPNLDKNKYLSKRIA